MGAGRPRPSLLQQAHPAGVPAAAADCFLPPPPGPPVPPQGCGVVTFSTQEEAETAMKYLGEPVFEPFLLDDIASLTHALFPNSPRPIMHPGEPLLLVGCLASLVHVLFGVLLRPPNRRGRRPWRTCVRREVPYCRSTESVFA